MRTVVVILKTGPDGGVTMDTEACPKQKYLTMEDAVEAATEYLHKLADNKKMIGFIEVEEG